MIKDFVEGVVGSVTKTWGNVGLAGILFLILIGILITGTWMGLWDNGEKGRIDMLKSLHELSLAGIEKNPKLSPIYNDIVTKLSNTRREVASISTPIGFFFKGNYLEIHEWCIYLVFLYNSSYILQTIQTTQAASTSYRHQCFWTDTYWSIYSSNTYYI